MATRFYLPSTGAAAVSVTPDAAWDATGSAQSALACVTTRIESAMANGSTVSPFTGENWLARQFVSGPIGAGEISGTIKGWIRAASTEDSNETTVLGVRVVSGDGATVRGTLLAVGEYGSLGISTGTPSSTDLANAFTLDAVTAQNGDRIVIELGVSEGAGSEPFGAHYVYGDDSGTDLAESGSNTNPHNPWVEFSDTLPAYEEPEPPPAPGGIEPGATNLSGTVTLNFDLLFTKTIGLTRNAIDPLFTRHTAAVASTGAVYAERHTILSGQTLTLDLFDGVLTAYGENPLREDVVVFSVINESATDSLTITPIDWTPGFDGSHDIPAGGSYAATGTLPALGASTQRITLTHNAETTNDMDVVIVVVYS